MGFQGNHPPCWTIALSHCVESLWECFVDLLSCTALISCPVELWIWAVFGNSPQLIMPSAVGDPANYIPPDGGWGWMVVVGAFISVGFSCAFGKSVTIFYKEIQDIFHASSSEVSWISSIMFAVMYAGGKCYWIWSLSQLLAGKQGSSLWSVFVFVFASYGFIIEMLEMLIFKAMPFES